MKTLKQIKEEIYKIGICTNECECDFGEDFREEDRTLLMCYCKGDYQNVKFCEWYKSTLWEERNFYYMDQRFKRTEEALKLPEE